MKSKPAREGRKSLGSNLDPKRGHGGVAMAMVVLEFCGTIPRSKSTTTRT